MAHQSDRSGRRFLGNSTLGMAVLVTVVTALITVAILILLLTRLVFDTWRPWTVAQAVTLLDIAKFSLAIVAGVGATQGLVVAYRRQRHLETDQTSLVTRFGDAASQLAGSQAAERLAGVYALAALADEWTSQRQQCINVLCAYLRLPFRNENGEAEVRMAIVDLFSHRLHSRRTEGWQDNNFHLEGAVIPRKVYFEDVVVRGWMNLRGVTFMDGASFVRSRWHRPVYIESATFAGEGTTFSYATFEGSARFNNVEFENRASFTCVTFNQRADFGHALFRKRASFRNAQFHQTADFGSAIFASTANLNSAVFHEKVNFGAVEFLAAAYFRDVRCSPEVGEVSRVFSASDFFAPDLVEWGPFPEQRPPSPLTRSGRARRRRIDALNLTLSDPSDRPSVGGG
jgi:pentapeptide repeat protein